MGFGKSGSVKIRPNAAAVPVVMGATEKVAVKMHDRIDTSLGPNRHLIGLAGSRSLLSTPCLVLDLPKLKRNIETAASFCKTHKIALRPHAKTHKCSQIARLQSQAEAVGICVATVGEAEQLAKAGINNILITSAITQNGKIERATALAKTMSLTLVADDPDVVRWIGQVASTKNVEIPLLVDLDLGRHRNGVTNAAQALVVAQAIANTPSLRLKGLQAYASHISHVESYADRLAASQSCANVITNVKEALKSAGHKIETITGGSTGTLFMDPSLNCYSELQCGSYVFSDVEYQNIDINCRQTSSFDPALFVRVAVIGRNWPGRVTCDGGNKHFSAKGTLPTLVSPPVHGAVYRPDSDEHGIIELPGGAEQPALGTGFELVVPHCDPTVNLYDHYHVVEGDTLIDIWRIEGRGAY